MDGQNGFLIFRQKDLNGLVCAVPEHGNRPLFLTPTNWEFGGRIDKDHAPKGFRYEEALSLAGINGFYLHHSVCC
ncbi:MAG: hypothetical protein LBR29_04985 [Methylobacteriaceae bacterium]|jgi:hypothetical protein|nr:hypothetical protein [Methylobacteriaceae bacterium]